MSGCDIRLVFTFPPKDTTLQYKKCTSEITFLAFSALCKISCITLRSTVLTQEFFLCHMLGVFLLFHQNFNCTYLEIANIVEIGEK